MKSRLLSLVSLTIVLLLAVMALRHGQPALASESAVSQSSLQWVTEDVDTTESCFDMNVSLALGADGVPHISYFDTSASALRYAYRTDSGWASTIVDNSGYVGRHSSLALDSSQHPHIAYRDATLNSLKYASWDGAEWGTEFVALNDQGWEPSLEIDSNDYPHIAYLGIEEGPIWSGGSQRPKYARWTGSQWAIELIQSRATANQISLALDSVGRPHVSYDHEWTVYHAVYSDTMWITETVDSPDISVFDVGLYNSIVIDSQDDPHMSYALWTNMGSPTGLKYAKKPGADWEQMMLDGPAPVGYFSALGLDGDDYPHISYYDSENDVLKYIYWDGVDWMTMVVDSAVSMDGRTSLAVDSGGQPHIVYCNEQSGSIRYARLIMLDNHLYAPIVLGRS